MIKFRDRAGLDGFPRPEETAPSYRSAKRSAMQRQRQRHLALESSNSTKPNRINLIAAAALLFVIAVVALPPVAAAACRSDASCLDSQYCDQGLLFGSCTPKRKLGHACEPYSEEYGDRVCATGVCSPVGKCAECRTARDCPQGRYCSSRFTCEKVKGLTELCSSDASCASGICKAGACSGCRTHEDCPPLMWCPTGPGTGCAKKRQVSLSCEGARECASGYCTGGRCVQCSTDYDCELGSYCSTFYTCIRSKERGAQCVRDRECKVGRCSWSKCGGTAPGSSGVNGKGGKGGVVVNQGNSVRT